MTKPNIPNQRLLNQRIAGRKLEKPEQVVKQLGALQAQDYHQALWAVGLRMHSATVSDIEQSIADRKIILTWPMRGTIHFVPSEDLRWMLKLLTPRILAQGNRRLEQLELDQKIIERCKQIIYDVLKGDKQIARPDLMQLLEEEGISTRNQRGYHILWYLAQTSFICMGPRSGKQQTFALLDEWVPRAKEIARDEALSLISERYFTSHGPATVQDFSWWAGMTISDARKGVEAAKSSLISEKANGQEYWVAKHIDVGSTSDNPTVFLLPGYDEYLLGYKNRSAVLNAEHAHQVVPGNNGVFMPTIIIDGQVSGTWKRSIKNKGINIEFNLFVPLEDWEHSIIEAARRYCEFMGLPLGSTAFK